jgi:hypothetical protein
MKKIRVIRVISVIRESKFKLSALSMDLLKNPCHQRHQRHPRINIQIIRFINGSIKNPCNQRHPRINIQIIRFINGSIKNPCHQRHPRINIQIIRIINGSIKKSVPSVSSASSANQNSNYPHYQWIY